MALQPTHLSPSARQSARQSESWPFGHMLRDWRHKRGLSQLDLALASEVSQRHLSFLESGRSMPSRDMIVRLGTMLDVPMRDQNAMLMAAGFAAIYPERTLEAPEMQQVHKALTYMLKQQEPYPAIVFDQHWNLIMGNEASTRLMKWLQTPLLVQLSPDEPLNLLRLMFHPEGIRPYIKNWHDIASHLIERVHREAVAGGQLKETTALLEELLNYPDVPQSWQVPNGASWQAPMAGLEFERDGLELNFFSTITTLGTPQDITLQELRLECFFPADDLTERNIEILTQSVSITS